MTNHYRALLAFAGPALLTSCATSAEPQLAVPYGVKTLCPDTELQASGAFSGPSRLPERAEKALTEMLQAAPQGERAFRLSTVGNHSNVLSFTLVPDQGVLVARVHSRGGDQNGPFWSWMRAVSLSGEQSRRLVEQFENPALWEASGGTKKVYGSATWVESFEKGVLTRRASAVGIEPHTEAQHTAAQRLKEELARLAACPAKTGG